MNECPYMAKLSTYHDGELSAVERQELEAHLPHCPACAAELERFARLSAALAAFQPPRISCESLRRIAAEPPVWLQRGYLRFVEAVSGIAAAILLAAAGWMFYQQQSPPAPTGTTSSAIAIAVNPEQLDTSDTRNLQLPDWVDDFTGQQRP